MSGVANQKPLPSKGGVGVGEPNASLSLAPTPGPSLGREGGFKVDFPGLANNWRYLDTGATAQKPQVVIDLKRIPGLMAIRSEGGGFLIGAATSGATLGEHEALKAAWPGVVEAANLIGSTQVQGRASLGGNLCNASPAADSVPALIAAGAVCVIEGPSGSREVAVEKVQTGPGKTTLADDEILVALRLPARTARSSDAYLRLIPRTEMDIAVVGVGVSLTLDAGDGTNQMLDMLLAKKRSGDRKDWLQSKGNLAEI